MNPEIRRLLRQQAVWKAGQKFPSRHRSHGLPWLRKKPLVQPKRKLWRKWTTGTPMEKAVA